MFVRKQCAEETKPLKREKLMIQEKKKKKDSISGVKFLRKGRRQEIQKMSALLGRRGGDQGSGCQCLANLEIARC